MVYKRTDDEKILEAIVRAFDIKKSMESQRELRDRVLKELHKTDPKLTVSGSRIRVLAITSGNAKIEIHWRETGEKKARNRCPVCGSQLKATKNETVFGGTVTLGFSCPMCPFRSTMKRKEPTRYIFSRKRA